MIEAVHPSLIYNEKVLSQDSIQAQITDVIDKIKDNSPNWWTLWGNTFEVSNLDGDIISEYGLTELELAIHHAILMYCSSVGFAPRNYTRKSWWTVVKPNHNAHLHDHNYYDIAGSYYYKTNNKDGDLYFQCMNPNASSLVFQQLSKPHFITPEVGRIIMFPGWMLHGITTNKTSHTRIGISFTILFNR